MRLAVLIQSGARLTSDAEDMSVPVFLDDLAFVSRARVEQAVRPNREPRDEMFGGHDLLQLTGGVEHEHAPRDRPPRRDHSCR